MMNVNGQEIEVTQGDTGAFSIIFIGDDAPDDGVGALVSVKKTKTSETVEWEKNLTVSGHAVEVTLTQADTDLPFGQYWWDVRLIYEGDEVYTPMKPAPFRILEVIGEVEVSGNAG